MQQPFIKTVVTYKNHTIDFQYYAEMIRASFRRNEKTNDYILAVQKFILGEDLSKSELQKINPYYSILEQPYYEMRKAIQEAFAKEGIEEDNLEGINLESIKKTSLPNHSSLAELHVCKLFMRITYAKLIAPYIQDISVLKKMSEILNQDDQLKVYRVLEVRNSKEYHDVLLMPIVMLISLSDSVVLGLMGTVLGLEILRSRLSLESDFFGRDAVSNKIQSYLFSPPPVISPLKDQIADFMQQIQRLEKPYQFEPN